MNLLTPSLERIRHVASGPGAVPAASLPGAVNVRVLPPAMVMARIPQPATARLPLPEMARGWAQQSFCSLLSESSGWNRNHCYLQYYANQRCE